MGAWQEIADVTVQSSTPSVVINNFGTITKDDFVKVVATIVLASSSGSETGLYPNGNTTNTNYYNQTLLSTGTTVVAARGNVNRFGYGTETTRIAYIKLSENNKFNMFTFFNGSNSSTLETDFDYTTSTVDFSSGITSFTFQAFGSNNVQAGTRFQIYKLAAEKVADITVASNTTQVDISNLSIDKDSEYLLVSDVTGATATHFVVVTPNDQTTLSGYYTQRIQGSGSTASASRGNENRIQEGLSSENSLAYVHIKLSNIGAYTMQSYSSRASGSSTVDVQNWFTSSTAENITSITKLNIFTTNANAIGAGSRFILYKLY